MGGDERKNELRVGRCGLRRPGRDRVGLHLYPGVVCRIGSRIGDRVFRLRLKRAPWECGHDLPSALPETGDHHVGEIIANGVGDATGRRPARAAASRRWKGPACFPALRRPHRRACAVLPISGRTRRAPGRARSLGLARLPAEPSVAGRPGRRAPGAGARGPSDGCRIPGTLTRWPIRAPPRGRVGWAADSSAPAHSHGPNRL